MTRRTAVACFVAASAIIAVALGSGLPRTTQGANGQADESRRMELLAQELAAELSAAQRAATVSEQPGDGILERARSWMAAQTEAMRLTIERNSEGPMLIETTSASTSTNSATVLAASGLTLIRNGQEWGRLRLELLSDQPADAVRSALAEPAVVIGSTALCAVLIIATLRSARPTRTRDGMPWSRARERVAQTLDFLSEGVLVVDPRGCVVFANSAILSAIGKDRSAIIGRPANWLPIERDADAPHTGETTSNGPPWDTVLSTPEPIVRSRVRLRSADGSARDYNACFRVIRDGKRVHGVLVMLDDVTQLEAQRAQLEVARDQAERANEAKSTFLANMSHEIRTPMNGVLGTLDLLRDTPLDGRQRQFTDAAQLSATALLHLINDILDFSKIEAGKLDMLAEAFSIEACVLNAARIVRPMAEGKGLALIVDATGVIGQRVVGDESRLRQVLINLLSNALKFTERGEVEVTVRSLGTENLGERLEVHVRDTGPGIPKDRLDRLFKSFSQVDASTTRKHGGTGLGLAISKQLVELMHGRIWVESQPGRGSTFSFDMVLPAADPAETPRQRLLADTAVVVCAENTRSRRVLVSYASEFGSGLVEPSDLESLKACSDRLSARFERVVVLVSLSGLDDATEHALASLRESDRPLRIVVLAPSRLVAEQTDRVGHGLAPLADAWEVQPLGSVELVRAMAPAQTPSDQPTDSALAIDLSPLKGRRVLIAEDNAVGQMIAREYVESFGMSCTTVDRGDTAAEHAARGGFDVILMDCHLPEMDGYQATRAIREAETAQGCRRCKIIALTASAMAGDRERCEAAGMDGYVTKPVERTALAAALLRVVHGDVQGPHSIARIQPPSVDPAAPAAYVPGLADETTDTPDMLDLNRPDSPPIDVNELLDRCLRKAEIAQQMLMLFEQRTTEDLAAIASLVRSGDRKALSETAHSIAGAALQVGAREVGTLARQIEAMAASWNDAHLADQVEHLRRAYGRCVEFMPAVDLGEQSKQASSAKAA